MVGRAQTSTSRVEDSPAFAFHKFHDLLGVFRLDPHFFESRAKVFEKCVEVRFVQTLTSGQRMSSMNVFAPILSPAEEHGNEHELSGAKVVHVSSTEEVAQAIILQNSPVKAFRSSRDGVTSTDQVIQLVNHRVLTEQ